MVYVYLSGLVFLSVFSTYLIFSPQVRDNLIERLGLITLVFMAVAECYHVVFGGAQGVYSMEIVFVGLGLVFVASLHRAPKIKKSGQAEGTHPRS